MKLDSKAVMYACGAVATIIAMAVAGFVVFSEDSGCEPAPKETDAKVHSKAKKKFSSPSEAVRAAMSGKDVPRSRLGEKPAFADIFDHLPPRDRALAEALQSALDDDNITNVVSAARRALSSTNSEVRVQAVESLGWFGAEALAELTPLMVDADEDVAEAAQSQFELALGEIDSQSLRVSIAEAVMKTLPSKDALSMIVSEITAQDDNMRILQSLIDIIDSGNAAGVEVALEEYETLTHEEWSGIEAAEAWLQENMADEENEEETDDAASYQD